MKDLILLSVIIPCRNEEKYIENCLLSLVNQKGVDFGYEILVVDGMSGDATRGIIRRNPAFKEKVRIIDNPHRTTPQAMNLGIDNSRGEIVVICGAHSIYDKYFLKSGIELFKKVPDASGVGGPIVSIGDSKFGKAAALAMSSPIGVGNAKHRFPEFEGYAEMACFPFYKKEIFEKIGKFDEFFVRNQDDEFSFRLRLNGGKIYISPKVKSTYFVRSSPGKLFRQYFQYGFWRYYVLKKHKKQISFRQIIPSLFILTMVIFFILGIISHNFIFAEGLLLIYLTAVFAASLKIFLKYGVVVGLYFLLSVCILHNAYGGGLIYAISKSLVGK